MAMGSGMEPSFSETRPIMPKSLTLIMAAVLLATAAFMAVWYAFADSGMTAAAVAVVAAVFVLIIAVMLTLRMSVSISSEGVAIVFAFRTVEIPAKEIIDVRSGDLGDIRSYAGWNLKGVKHSSYLCIGDDTGVALKLTGKRVVVFSTPRFEEAAGIVSGLITEEG